MQDAGEVSTLLGQTSTQVGAIGELIASAGILHASGGRLSPFKPLADDDGLDLLLLDKQTRKSIPLQIKSRRRFDNPKAQTVQFDVGIETLSETADGYVLCMRLEGIVPQTFWLIPTAELRGVARPAPNKLVVVASAKDSSSDKFSRYRLTSFTQVVDRILARSD